MNKTRRIYFRGTTKTGTDLFFLLHPRAQKKTGIVFTNRSKFGLLWLHNVGGVHAAEEVSPVGRLRFRNFGCEKFPEVSRPDGAEGDAAPR